VYYGVIHVTHFSVRISNKFCQRDINILYSTPRDQRGLAKKQTNKLRVFLTATIIPCV